jgi:hypothetical protein
VSLDAWEAINHLPSFAEAWTSLQLPPPRLLPVAISAARTAVSEALLATLRIPDVALTKNWVWPGQTNRPSIRVGLYLLYHTLEEAAAKVDGWDGYIASRPSQARRILAQATTARWDFHGLLLPLETPDLDRPPGGGEWTLRETLAHVVVAQALYTLRTAYWARQPRVGGPLSTQPDLPVTSLPDAAWSAGTLREIERRLDTALDLSVGLLGNLDESVELDKLALWYGFDVTVRFRLHVFAMHLREHTIQVEKTLAMLGRQPTEVERIARICLGAYGHLEGSLLCYSAESLDRKTEAGTSRSNYLADVVQRIGFIANALVVAATDVSDGS